MKTNKITYLAIALVLNVVVGTAVSLLKIPFLYLDTVGTIIIAAMYGPISAIIVGFATNIVMVFTTGDIITAFFGLVNAGVGLCAGLIFKKMGVNYKSALLIGILTAFLAPAIGTPIALYFYGGLDYNASDIIKVYFNQLINNFTFSVYIEKVINNLIDKIATVFLVVFVIKRTRLPKIK